MASNTQGAPGYYVWEVPGKPVAIHIHLDVVDRILAEVMRGFGAVPKRGAEVGGVLLGRIEPGDPAIVRVEDFDPVECEYKRGPSYLFTSEDGAAFEAAVGRWQPEESRDSCAVGFYRSHTRDGLSLAPEDVELMDQYFPSPSHIALLVKPFGTKVSRGGFFVREDGVFPEATPLEFPFRRRELSGEEPPPSRSMIERRPRQRDLQTFVSTPVMEAPENDVESAEPRPPGPAYAVTLPSKSRLRSSIWIPLSFVFLLFGVALGFMIALARPPASSVMAAADFSLGLSVAKEEDDLRVNWDPQSPAVRAAQRGTLEIQEGGLSKVVDLDTANLQSGKITVQKQTDSVHFRLTVFPRAGVSVTQTAEWRQ
ncbi:MAG TPA: hypothetical protein VK419_10975 [Bryobacteraceae bacterium]|nr:hypothetical protein [Bryobacteraceae bacterium]